MKDYLLGMHDNTAAVWTDTLGLNSILNTVDLQFLANPVVGHRASRRATEYRLSVFTELQSVNNRDV